jgi:GTP pyrophosphokinase
MARAAGREAHRARTAREQGAPAGWPLLAEAWADAEVQGRPKHLYSIWKKMQGKGLAIERVFDLRALRVIVDDKADCYAALARVHEPSARWTASSTTTSPAPRPTATRACTPWCCVGDDGRPLEVQIRTRAMHEHAEHGVAAHWAYKEAGAKGYAGSAPAATTSSVAEARKAVLRELLAWERDFPGGASSCRAGAAFDDRIYVFTPQATVVDLPAGATPVDFAYTLHTDLGHRCRGARSTGPWCR